MGIKLSRCFDAGLPKKHISSQAVAPQKQAEVKDQFEQGAKPAAPQVPIKILDPASEEFSTLSSMSSSAPVLDSESEWDDSGSEC